MVAADGHACEPPELMGYKDIWTCGCRQRFICIDIGRRFPDLAPWSIWKETVATTRWPRLLRIFG